MTYDDVKVDMMTCGSDAINGMYAVLVLRVVRFSFFKRGQNMFFTKKYSIYARFIKMFTVC